MPNSLYIIRLFLKKCVGCGICVELCPKYAIPSSLIGFISSVAKINENKCDVCGNCVQACSHGALKILKREGLWGSYRFSILSENLSKNSIFNDDEHFDSGYIRYWTNII